jgi:hypothetical protein
MGRKLRCQTLRRGNMGDQLRTKQGRRTEFVGTIAGKGRNLHQESCRFRLAEVFADHSGLQPRLVSSDCLFYRLNKAYNSAFP